MIIFMKMWWGSRDKDAAYLKSYKIESEFYKYNGDDVPGFRIPSVYYNLEVRTQFCWKVREESEVSVPLDLSFQGYFLLLFD